MLPQKTVFRSAFTPQGWVSPADDTAGHTLLLGLPPTVTDTCFWHSCLPDIATNASEIFLDPFVPAWAEGFALSGQNGSQQLLKSDHLHPRAAANAPFGDSLLDLHYLLQPPCAKAQQEGLLLYKRCRSALCNARSALEITHSFLAEDLRCAAARVRIDKVLLLAAQLADEIFAMPLVDTVPKAVNTRFFTAATPHGTMLCSDTLRHRSDKFYLIDDAHGAAARMLLYRLLCIARQRGEAVCIGRCPLFWPDKIDHLLFPARRVLLTVCNRWHRLVVPGQHIACHDLLMYPGSGAECQRSLYSRKRAAAMYKDACRSLREVWRLQTALADRCSLVVPSNLCGQYLRSSIMAKNTADT